MILKRKDFQVTLHYYHWQLPDYNQFSRLNQKRRRTQKETKVEVDQDLSHGRVGIGPDLEIDLEGSRDLDPVKEKDLDPSLGRDIRNTRETDPRRDTAETDLDQETDITEIEEMTEIEIETETMLMSSEDTKKSPPVTRSVAEDQEVALVEQRLLLMTIFCI